MKTHPGLMSISDFSLYCGTTRQALQYYDRINLLKPFQRGSQGYRYYHSLQGHEVRLIHSLQRSGCSLDEVEDILNSPDIDTLESHILEKQKALELELQKVRREQIFLMRFYRFLNWAGRFPLDTPGIYRSNRPMHLCEVVQVESCAPYTYSYYEMVTQYADYCRGHHSVQVYPYVLYVDPDNLWGDRCFSKVLCFPEDMETPAEHAYIAPSGDYLCLRDHPDQGKDIRPAAYEKLFAYMDAHGLRPSGGSLEIPFCIPRGLRKGPHQFSVVFVLPVTHAEAESVSGGGSL